MSSDWRMGTSDYDRNGLPANGEQAERPGQQRQMLPTHLMSNSVASSSVEEDSYSSMAEPPPLPLLPPVGMVEETLPMPDIKPKRKFIPDSWRNFWRGRRGRAKSLLNLSSSWGVEECSPPVSPFLNRRRDSTPQGMAEGRDDWSISRSEAGPTPLLLGHLKEEEPETAESYVERMHVYQLKHAYMKSWPGLLRLLGVMELLFGAMVFACICAYIQKDSQWYNFVGGSFPAYGLGNNYYYTGPKTTFVLVMAGLAWIVTVGLLVLGLSLYYRTILLDSDWWPLTEFTMNTCLFFLYMAAGIVYVNGFNLGGLCYTMMANSPLYYQLCRVESGQIAAAAFLFVNMLLYLVTAGICLKVWRHELTRREREALASQRGTATVTPQKRRFSFKRMSSRTNTPRVPDEEWTKNNASQLNGLDTLNKSIPSGFIPKPLIVPDYVTKYPKIESVEERERYKGVFNDQYAEYRELHTAIHAANRKFVELKTLIEKLPHYTETSEEHRRIMKILEDYKEKKNDPTFVEKKQRCTYLKNKLSYVKQRIKEYDRECDSSGRCSTAFLTIEPLIGLFCSIRQDQTSHSGIDRSPTSPRVEDPSATLTWFSPSAEMVYQVMAAANATATWSHRVTIWNPSLKRNNGMISPQTPDQFERFPEGQKKLFSLGKKNYDFLIASGTSLAWTKEQPELVGRTGQKPTWGQRKDEWADRLTLGIPQLANGSGLRERRGQQGKDIEGDSAAGCVKLGEDGSAHPVSEWALKGPLAIIMYENRPYGSPPAYSPTQYSQPVAYRPSVGSFEFDVRSPPPGSYYIEDKPQHFYKWSSPPGIIRILEGIVIILCLAIFACVASTLQWQYGYGYGLGLGGGLGVGGGFYPGMGGGGYYPGLGGNSYYPGMGGYGYGRGTTDPRAASGFMIAMAAISFIVVLAFFITSISKSQNSRSRKFYLLVLVFSAILGGMELIASIVYIMGVNPMASSGGSMYYSQIRLICSRFYSGGAGIMLGNEYLYHYCVVDPQEAVAIVCGFLAALAFCIIAFFAQRVRHKIWKYGKPNIFWDKNLADGEMGPNVEEWVKTVPAEGNDDTETIQFSDKPANGINVMDATDYNPQPTTYNLESQTDLYHPASYPSRNFCTSSEDLSRKHPTGRKKGRMRRRRSEMDESQYETDYTTGAESCDDMNEEEWGSLYPPITSDLIRQEYKSEFDTDHQEYKQICAEMNEVNNQINYLSKRLDVLTEDDPNYQGVAEEYNRLKNFKKTNEYQSKRLKTKSLKTKLSYIKRVVNHYDRQREQD
ncbi:uncharacterized protein [Narcine bancroftii]|uniref:uncharacterized protein n=1 Tax=Narcine bancroftii TaxID=1343680 RepID=UPI00383147B8